MNGISVYGSGFTSTASYMTSYDNHEHWEYPSPEYPNGRVFVHVVPPPSLDAAPDLLKVEAPPATSHYFDAEAEFRRLTGKQSK